MRQRISKAKAFIVVRNYAAAIFELENLRKESGDPAVRAVVNVLLMNSYLEQGDYKRAQDFLNQFYSEQKTTKAGAADAYAAVAGQVIKGARTRADRYKTLGLNMADRTLPLEALNDLEKMRETLEIVITQAKDISKTPGRASDAMALLEEASTSRTIIARDDYDAKLWKDAIADAREDIASSRSVVQNAVNDNTGSTLAVTPTNNVPINGGSIQTASVTESKVVLAPPQTVPTVASGSDSNTVRDRQVSGDTAEREAKKDDKIVIVPSAPPTNPDSKPAEQKPVTTGSGEAIDIGALIPYATRQAAPVYPPTARTMRTAGIVKVEITVNEAGDVVDVKKTTGPLLLQAAAKDAIKKWKFKPFVREGQPVKANGFINFNFTL
jgi:TonB family protein